MNDDKIKLGVLWKNTGRDGKTPYMSGRVQQDGLDAAVAELRKGGRFLVLKNTKRPDKRDPDCVLYVVPDRNPQAPAPAAPAAARGRV
jgi:hypothetical protein